MSRRRTTPVRRCRSPRSGRVGLMIIETIAGGAEPKLGSICMPEPSVVEFRVREPAGAFDEAKSLRISPSRTRPPMSGVCRISSISNCTFFVSLQHRQRLMHPATVRGAWSVSVFCVVRMLQRDGEEFLEASPVKLLSKQRRPVLRLSSTGSHWSTRGFSSSSSCCTREGSSCWRKKSNAPSFGVMLVSTTILPPRFDDACRGEGGPDRRPYTAELPTMLATTTSTALDFIRRRALQVSPALLLSVPHRIIAIRRRPSDLYVNGAPESQTTSRAPPDRPGFRARRLAF